MRSIPTTMPAAMLTVLVLAGCQADREAAEPVDITPDPRIEAAPAYPTPPGEVPIGLEPAPAGEATDTVSLDTVGAGARSDTANAGARPTSPP